LSISVGDIVQQQGQVQPQGMVLDQPKPFAPAAPIAKPSPAANAVASMDDDIPFN
jgi:hypothetical protein